MKRKMIIKKLSVLTLGTIFTSNILLPSTLIYAFPTEGINHNIEKEEKKEIKESNYSQIGGVENFTQNENDVLLDLSTGEKIRISFLKEDVLRIYMDPTG